MTDTQQAFFLGALVVGIVALGISYLRRSDDAPTAEDWAVGVLAGVLATSVPMVVVAAGLLVIFAASVAAAVRRA